MRAETIKTKLEAMKVRGSTWCMVDLLRLYDEGRGEMHSDEYYLKFVDALESLYKSKLQNINSGEHRSNYRQIDIIEAISEAKKGNL